MSTSKPHPADMFSKSYLTIFRPVHRLASPYISSFAVKMWSLNTAHICLLGRSLRTQHHTNFTLICSCIMDSHNEILSSAHLTELTFRQLTSHTDTQSQIPACDCSFWIYGGDLPSMTPGLSTPLLMQPEVETCHSCDAALSFKPLFLLMPHSGWQLH